MEQEDKTTFWLGFKNNSSSVEYKVEVIYNNKIYIKESEVTTYWISIISAYWKALLKIIYI